MGNPMMVKGGPSLNPAGRPKVGLSLAEAMRKRFPVSRIVDMAEQMFADATDERVKMQALQFIADRAHGKVLSTTEITINDGTGETASVDWSKVPVERRRALLNALSEVDGMAAPMPNVETPTDEDGDVIEQ